MSWTNGTKASAPSYTNASKNSTSFTNGNKTAELSCLLVDSSVNKLEIDSIGNFLLLDALSYDGSWTNAVKN